MNRNPEYSRIPDHLFRDEDARERKRLEEVWQIAGSAEPAGFITKEQTEEARTELFLRLGLIPDKGKSTKHIVRWSRWLAAAVALLAAGLVLTGLPQTVTAPHGQLAEITLPDGSSAELNSGAVLQYNRLFGFTNRDITLRGEAFFDVEAAAQPFRVYANGTVTEVTGTQFAIRSWPDQPEGQTNITVLEGEVRFYPESTPSKLVSLSGEHSSLWRPGLGKPADPEPADIERMTGWRDQKFIFYEQTLSEIFDELERRFDLVIDLEKSVTANETLTGYYGEAKDPESLINDICTVAGLNYAETSTGFRVY